MTHPTPTLVLIQLPPPPYPGSQLPPPPVPPLSQIQIQTFPDFSDSTPKLSSQSDQCLHWSYYHCIPQHSPPPSILCRPDHCPPGASGPIPMHLTPPCPKPLPSAIHLSETSPHTLAHWWFSAQRTQLPWSYRPWQSSVSTHQPFNLEASSSPSNKLSPVYYTREPFAC